MDRRLDPRTPPSSDGTEPMSTAIGAVPTKPPEEAVSEKEDLTVPSDAVGEVLVHGPTSVPLRYQMGLTDGRSHRWRRSCLWHRPCFDQPSG